MSSSEVAELLSREKVTLSHIRRAIHHLPKSTRAVLYEETHPLHSSATGAFFEALSYELLLSASENSSSVVSIAAKLADAVYIPYDKYAPDGLWYSRDGGIRFKVKGRVAAEMDLLIKTSDGVRIFGEVITGSTGTKGFLTEIAAKKSLLFQIYGDPVGFLLVLPYKPRAGLRCVDENDAFVVIPGGDSLYKLVPESEVIMRNLSPAQSAKRVDGRLW
ncbi:hypothetical protein SDC9_25391 [bioreactor metagenome]|uniref:Uncharacterized protein n=1 Tax=bioreactor metagenome TaxID=1076179 RepID=A0A644UKY6_9ZZZZ|nr:hypothetical protein [Methanocorpusculum sp.]